MLLDQLSNYWDHTDGPCKVNARSTASFTYTGSPLFSEGSMKRVVPRIHDLSQLRTIENGNPSTLNTFTSANKCQSNTTTFHHASYLPSKHAAYDPNG